MWRWKKNETSERSAKRSRGFGRAGPSRCRRVAPTSGGSSLSFS
jgi:hypothetical protein